MKYRSFFVGLIGVCFSLPLSAQISRDAKYDILRTVIADQASARIGLPFGTDGVELSDAGEINQSKLEKDLKKNGQSIEPGRVVTVTDIAFDDDKIEIELDGGGKNKKNFLDRIQVGVGVGDRTAPVGREDKTAKAKGSKVIVKFAKKVPGALTPDQLKEILKPLLDFNKHNFMKTGIDALTPEFQEAVKAKEARIGMDRSTVIMALGRPDNKFRETKNGVYTEQWLYNQRGLRALFITFEDNVVVEIKQY
ncbi:MAG: hypothetical protein DMG14_06280 [Acidobacteria bacterium]|nr:MAG: hypothetical protein DMG14_06280 [Acidobacteriota bacterium]